MRFGKKDIVVVLGCVVFLFACLGAAGNSGRRRAKEAVCYSNLRRWGAVFTAFANDNDGYFMDRSDASEWYGTLEPYYRNRRLLFCPDARKTYYEGAINPHMAWLYEDENLVGVGSYCINLWISDEWGSGKVGSGVEEFWRTPHVAGAEQVPILADGQWKDADPVQTDEPPLGEFDIWEMGTNEMKRVCINRHNCGVNVVFLDSSVRKIGLKQLWRLKWHRTFDVGAPQPVWPGWMVNFKDY